MEFGVKIPVLTALMLLNCVTESYKRIFTRLYIGPNTFLVTQVASYRGLDGLDASLDLSIRLGIICTGEGVLQIKYLR